MQTAMTNIRNKGNFFSKILHDKKIAIDSRFEDLQSKDSYKNGRNTKLNYSQGAI